MSTAPIKPQPRAALLRHSAPKHLISFTIDGQRWITDKFVMVRENLFKTPPTKVSDYPTVTAAMARRLLRGYNYAETLPLSRVKHLAIGNDHEPDPTTVYAHKGLLILLNRRVADGMHAAGMEPRLVCRPVGWVVAWYHHRNATQVTLCGIQMPLYAPVAVRRGAELSFIPDDEAAA